jgi:RsiW-degrading membrane proteinase PrsW (M82 family)
MYTVFSALAAIIPMSFYLLLIWRYDRFDREPVSLLLRNFFWGAFGAVILALGSTQLLASLFRYFEGYVNSRHTFELVILAPLIEETTKGIFLLSTVANRKFDNITDGLVYGGAIGLGFGMTENFLYFISNTESFGTWVTIVVIRTFFSGVMHCISTGLLGATLGYAKFRPFVVRVISIPVGLLLAIGVHMGWNYAVTALQSVAIGVLFLTICVIIFIFVFKFSLSAESRMIFNELSEEAAEGTLPEKYVKILSMPERDEPGWISEDIREACIKTATSLAFRKMQEKHSIGFNKNFYEREVMIHRTLLQKLFQNSAEEES